MRRLTIGIYDKTYINEGRIHLRLRNCGWVTPSKSSYDRIGKSINNCNVRLSTKIIWTFHPTNIRGNGPCSRCFLFREGMDVVGIGMGYRGNNKFGCIELWLSLNIIQYRNAKMSATLI